jgi:hypothetical protein
VAHAITITFFNRIAGLLQLTSVSRIFIKQACYIKPTLGIILKHIYYFHFVT